MFSCMHEKERMAVEGYTRVRLKWPVFVIMLKKKMHLSRLNSGVFPVQVCDWQSRRLWNTDPFKLSFAEVQSKVILWEVSAFQECLFKSLFWINTFGNYPFLLLSCKIGSCKSVGTWVVGGRFCIIVLLKAQSSLLPFLSCFARPLSYSYF